MSKLTKIIKHLENGGEVLNSGNDMKYFMDSSNYLRCMDTHLVTANQLQDIAQNLNNWSIGELKVKYVIEGVYMTRDELDGEDGRSDCLVDYERETCSNYNVPVKITVEEV